MSPRATQITILVCTLLASLAAPLAATLKVDGFALAAAWALTIGSMAGTLRGFLTQAIQSLSPVKGSVRPPVPPSIHPPPNGVS